jgi:hypothetical protein
MNNTSIAVAAIIIVLVVAAAGLALHPQSPLTIIYLFPDDIYRGWVRLFYPRDDNHGPRFPYPKPEPQPQPQPQPQPHPSFPPNGYNPNLPPLFPANPTVKPIPVAPTPEPSGYRPHPNIPAHHGFPVNPNGNIPFSPSPNPAPMRPSFPPNIQPIEPQHDKDLFPFAA